MPVRTHPSGVHHRVLLVRSQVAPAHSLEAWNGFGGMGLQNFREVFNGDGLSGMRIDPPELTITGFII